MKYEGLLLRELKSTSYQWLHVSCMEWLNFAEQSLDNGFCSIAGKASCFIYKYKASSVLLQLLLVVNKVVVEKRQCGGACILRLVIFTSCLFYGIP